jgi:myo-inositol-1(or 4)-monophosphatase
MNEQLVETALACVREAGALLLDYHRKVEALQIEAKGSFDYVTEADLAAQEAIINLIRSRHPDHEILAEEGKELFLAQEGQGASLNGRSIQVSSRRRQNEALVATAFPWRERALLSRYLEAFTRVFTEVSDIRRSGSAALDLAYVACGRCEGFWEVGLSPWDVAAGHLLVKEAGGHISDFTGGENHIWVGDVIAGNPSIHGFLLGIIREVFRGNVSAPRA